MQDTNENAIVLLLQGLQTHGEDGGISVSLITLTLFIYESSVSMYVVHICMLLYFARLIYFQLCVLYWHHCQIAVKIKLKYDYLSLTVLSVF